METLSPMSKHVPPGRARHVALQGGGGRQTRAAARRGGAGPAATEAESTAASSSGSSAGRCIEQRAFQGDYAQDWADPHASNTEQQYVFDLPAAGKN